MTDSRPRDASERESPDVLARDDELLSILARGDRPAGPTGGDPVAVMLAAWRADLDDPPGRTLRAAAPGPETVTPIPVTPVPEPRVQGRAAVRPSLGSASTRPGSRDRDGGPGGAVGPGGSVGPGRWRSRRYRLALVAAVLVLVAGGAAVGASNATPNSPLWPISQLLYPQRADRLGAQDALEQARVAAREGRLADATRLLDQAQALISKVADPAERTRLQQQLDQVRQLVSTAAGIVAPGSSTAPQPRPSGAPAPSGSPGAPPGPLPSVGLPTDILPTGILPTGILPTSLLPSLPIIGG